MTDYNAAPFLTTICYSTACYICRESEDIMTYVIGFYVISEYYKLYDKILTDGSTNQHIMNLTIRDSSKDITLVTN